MKYLADKIGDEYKEWRERNTIFISSPTGSGKTFFILNVFLPYLAQEGKKMLYLVNRTILKEQLENEINNLPIELYGTIDIESYQKIEEKMVELRLCDSSDIYKGFCASYYSNMYNKYDKYACVVCDEAHYFLADSNFNTNTMLSYNFIRDFFSHKLRIYMSATIEQIKEYVKKDDNERKYYRTQWYGFHSKSVTRQGVMSSIKEKEYSAEPNYDYIDIGILKQREEIAEIITGGTEKWLIFVDNKEFGKALRKDIMKRISPKEKTTNKKIVAFITSDYELDSDSANEVDSIVNTNQQSAKVLIATSVLDNGINLKDIELRNIIIIADTETEFIQMLGRKRTDNQHIKLYIYKQSKDHFIRRQRINHKRQRITKEYYKKIHEIIRPEVKKLEDSEQFKVKNIDDVNDIQPEVSKLEDSEQFKVKNIDDVNKAELSLILSGHMFLMQKVANNEVSFENIRSSFLIYGGVLILNLLSFSNIEYLNQYYQHILKEFDSYGENAFLREQLRWLHKKEDEIDEIIRRESINHVERSKQIIIEELKKIAGQALTKEEFIEIKNDLCDELLDLVESVGKDDPNYKKYRDSVKKNDRGISEYFMNFLREKCGIPFIVEKNDSEYTVTFAED